MALDPLALPADLGDGVVGEVGRALEDGVFFQAQGDVGCERDGAGEVGACGNDGLRRQPREAAAAVDGLLDSGGGVLGLAVGSGRFADVEGERAGGGRLGDGEAGR